MCRKKISYFKLCFIHKIICFRLETRPPSSPETKPVEVGEWRNVTLRPAPPSIPDRSQLDKHLTLPIVPPRRKKTDKLVKSGGFKEVFGNLTRPPSCDSNISTVKDLQLRRRNSSSDIPASEETAPSDDTAKKPKIVRKISKVGNRKSDQFFGENLSDCLSDEPVIDVSPKAIENPKPEVPSVKQPVVVGDEIDAFVLTNATKLEDNKAQKNGFKVMDDEDEKMTIEEVESVNLNKKAEFLMAMLDEYNSDEMRYFGAAPVEEPIIVPKRKHGRHICDDDEKLKNAISSTEIDFTNGHHHDHHAHLDNSRQPEGNPVLKPARKHSIKKEALGHKQHKTHSPQNKDEPIIRPTPRKPDRDMDKYRNSMELKVVPQHPTMARSLEAIQNETLKERSAPTLPAFNLSNQNGKSHLFDVAFENQGSPTLNEMEKLDTILKKCSSSQSFLTPDLMDQIVNKVYGFKMNWDDHDNVHNSGYDDCSGQVAPSSKLKTRKISVIRKDQITEKPIVEESAELERIANEKIEKEIKDLVNGKNSSNFSIGDVSITLTEIKSDDPTKKNEELSESPKKDPASDSKVESVEKTSILQINANEKPQLSEKLEHVDSESVKEQSLENFWLHPNNVNEKPDSTPYNEDTLQSSEKDVNPVSIIAKMLEKSAHQINDANEKLQSEKEVLPSVSDPKPDAEITKTITVDDSEPTKHVLKKSDTVIEIKQLDTSDRQSSPSVLDGIYTQNRSVLSSFQTYLNDHPKDNIANRKRLADTFAHSSDESDTEPMMAISNDRRGSIVDHDEWFNEHRAAIISNAHPPLPRENDVTLTYDTKTVYPFGSREKTLSESSEFFDTKLECSKADNVSSISAATSAQPELNDKDDHSTLLKFLPAQKKIMQ